MAPLLQRPKAKPLILHWLAGYSTAQLMMLFGGLGIFLINAISLILGLAREDPDLVPMSCGGMLWGGCFTAANLLCHRPNSDSLIIVLTLAGLLGAVCYFFFLAERNQMRRASKLLSEPAAPSDKTWPPPPTLPGGYRR